MTVPSRRRLAPAGRLAVVLALGVLAGPAGAAPWARFVTRPMASDTTFSALAARPLESLEPSERTWFMAQASWRVEIEEEAAASPRGARPWRHDERRTDARLASRLARDPRELGDSDLAWIEAEARRRWSGHTLRPQPEVGDMSTLSLLGALAAIGGLLWMLHTLADSIH